MDLKEYSIMHYILKFEIAEDAYFAQSVSIDKSFIGKLDDGIPLNADSVDISFPNSRGRLMDFIENLHSLLVVSEEIKNLFVEHGNEHIEVFEVTLKRKTDKKYFLINILNHIDCIDYEKSDFEEYIPGSRVFWKLDKLVFNDGKIRNRNCFRISNLSYEIVVSEKLKTALEKLEIEGLSFINISDYKFDRTKSNIS